MHSWCLSLFIISCVSNREVMCMKAIDIAEYIVQLAMYEGHPISNLMLQKTLYFVQGISLVELNEPAFEDDLIAWMAGPIVEEPYYKYCMWGCLDIYADITNSAFYKVPYNLRKLLNGVYHKAITYSVPELFRIICNKDTPYSKAYHRGKNESERIIFNIDLEHYFRKHYLGEG